MKKIYFFLLAIFLLVVNTTYAQNTNLPQGYHHLKDGIITINGVASELDAYIFGEPFEIKWFTNSTYTNPWDGFTSIAELWGYTNVADDHDTFEGLLKGTGIYLHEFDTIFIRGVQNGNGSSFDLTGAVTLTSSRTITLIAYYEEAYIFSALSVRHLNISGTSTIINITFIDVQLKGKFLQYFGGGGIRKYDATLNLTGANTINNFANIANCRDLSEPIAEGGNALSNYSCGVFNVGGILNMYGNLLITGSSGAVGVVSNFYSEFTMYGNVSISGNECTAVHNSFSNTNMYDEALISENYLGVRNESTFNMYGASSISENNAFGVDNIGIFNMFDNSKIFGNNNRGVLNMGIFNMYNEASILKNSTIDDGGGIKNHGDLNMYDFSSIIENKADFYGGGVANIEWKRGVLIRSMFNMYDSAHISNNTASIDGGGIYNNGGTVNLGNTSIANENIQITNNKALTGNGGAIWTNDYTKVFADSDVTFSGNTAYGNAELLDSSDPNFALYDSIYRANILTTAISPPPPFKYAYNNWDINYIKDSVITLNDRYLVYKDDGNIFIGSYYWLQEAVDACVAGDKGYSIFVVEDDKNVTDNVDTPVRIEKEKEITLSSLDENDIKTITQPNAARHILLDGKLTLENIILSGMSATDGINGGIEISSSKAELNMNQGSVIQNCCAKHGGAVYNNEGALNMYSDAIIRNNFATGWGGGVHNTGTLNMDDKAIISENSANYGGGIFNADDPDNFNGGEVNMSGCTSINRNRAVYGGGVCTGINGSFMMVKEASITENTGGLGGGVFNSGRFSMNDFTSISKNSVINGGGGGVSNVSGVFTMNNYASIFKNEADGGGGGVYNMYEETIFIMNDKTVISGNSAGSGGGVYNYLGVTFNMNNYSMIDNNSAALNGGGIYNDSTSTVRLGIFIQLFTPDVIQIINNTASNDGGAIWTGDYNNICAYQGVIFSQNSAGNGAHLLDSTDPNFTKIVKIHHTHIFTTTISPPNPPFQYAYNNWDINYINSKKKDFNLTDEHTQINTHNTCSNFLSVNENTVTTFSIVPNPATNNITITANTDFNTIEIFNLLGQTMLSQPNVGSSAKLDVSTLTNGVYFVRIIFANSTSVQKFVKQ